MPKFGGKRGINPRFRGNFPRSLCRSRVQEVGQKTGRFGAEVVDVQCERWRWGHKTIVPFHVGKEIMVQHQGDSRQQLGIDAGALEDAVNRGALQMDLPRKLRNAHPALVENGFDHLSNMEVWLRGHGAVSVELVTRKKRGIYFLLDTQGYHTPPT